MEALFRRIASDRGGATLQGHTQHRKKRRSSMPLIADPHPPPPIGGKRSTPPVGPLSRKPADRGPEKRRADGDARPPGAGKIRGRQRVSSEGTQTEVRPRRHPGAGDGRRARRGKHTRGDRINRGNKSAKVDAATRNRKRDRSPSHGDEEGTDRSSRRPVAEPPGDFPAPVHTPADGAGTPHQELFVGENAPLRGAGRRTANSRTSLRAGRLRRRARP